MPLPSVPSETRSTERAGVELADRKLECLRRSGLFGNDTKGATIKRACTADELFGAYRLVHDTFLATGYLTPEPSGLRLRLFETTSETATFIAQKDGAVVGVLSVVGDTPDLGLPSDSAFRTEFDGLRADGRRLCELTNQAVAEPYRRSAVATELMRCAVAHAVLAGFHEIAASVSPRHRGFYDLIGFRPLGSERSYSRKLHDPVIALRLDIHQFRLPPPESDETARFVHHFATAGNPFVDRVAEWGRIARRNFLNADLLERIFVHDRNFLAECNPGELEILRRRWGQEMFQVVTGVPESALEPNRGSAWPMTVAATAPTLAAAADEFCYDDDFFPDPTGLTGIGCHLLEQIAPFFDHVLDLFTGHRLGAAGLADEHQIAAGPATD